MHLHGTKTNALGGGGNCTLSSHAPEPAHVAIKLKRSLIIVEHHFEILTALRSVA